MHPVSSAVPPEPSANDTIVTSAIQLNQLLLVASSISLRLDGHIKLGGLTPDQWGDLLPAIGSNHRVTLWSDGTATLDAQGKGRMLAVRIALLNTPSPTHLSHACVRRPSNSRGVAGHEWRAAAA